LKNGIQKYLPSHKSFHYPDTNLRPTTNPFRDGPLALSGRGGRLVTGGEDEQKTIVRMKQERNNQKKPVYITGREDYNMLT
jgi:hypothetical protein